MEKITDSDTNTLSCSPYASMKKSYLSRDDQKNFKRQQRIYYPLLLTDLLASAAMLTFAYFKIINQTITPPQWLMTSFLGFAMLALLFMSIYCSIQNFRIPNKLKKSAYEVSKITLLIYALVNSISSFTIIFFSIILISGAENFKFSFFEKQSLYSHSAAFLGLSIACFVLALSSLLSTLFLTHMKYTKVFNHIKDKSEIARDLREGGMRLTALSYERSLAWLFFATGFLIAFLVNSNVFLSVNSPSSYAMVGGAFLIGFILMRIAATGEFPSRWQSLWSSVYRCASPFYNLFRAKPSLLRLEEKQTEKKQELSTSSLR